MRFGAVAVADAEGAILAHSVTAASGKLKKGRALTAADCADLAAAGVHEVTVARLDPDDLHEDAAAGRLAARIATGGRSDLRATQAFTGRVNLVADGPGLLRVDADAIAALNAVDPAITIATLADYARVGPGALLATLKIIPYAVPERAVAAAERFATPGILSVAPFRERRASLILSETDAITEKAVRKGGETVAARLAALGIALETTVRVPHTTDAIAGALRESTAPLRLILGASATSDAADVCPAAVIAAGGRLERFGMPVDPGNLLFLGEVDGAHVVGLPGCARSPALNGADWVLERLAAGLKVADSDIAAMGVGGLLKEIPTRPQPRAAPRVSAPAPRVGLVLLAAGRSSRMRGRDKLTEVIEGEALLRRSARRAVAAGLAVTVVVLPPEPGARAAALEGLALRHVTAARAADGMAESLKAGVTALGEVDAAIIALADMPEIDAPHYRALAAAFAPEEGREICRATASDGRPGQPVLFGRRFFESLATLSGDRGARSVVEEAADFLHDVALPGEAALLDLDTPEAFDRYRATGAAAG
ncbi:MAG: molybdopterin-binding/glycosyltransferase family 2 protein [Pseudomonadota bacterium]